MSELSIQFESEIKKLAAKVMNKMHKEEEYVSDNDIYTWKTYKQTFKATSIGSLVGLIIGALPGAGSSLAAYMSYGIVKRFSKERDKFGSGALDGVAGPESANSATCGGSIIPLFAFGIPGSATAALIGTALIMQGINLGPTMISENKLIMYTFFITLIYASFVNLGFSKILIPIYAKIAMINPKYVIPTVFTLAIIGTYATNNSITEVIILLVAGVFGVILKKNGFPLGPLVLGFIIGPGAERSLRQALLIGNGNWGVLFSTPLAIGLYITTILFLVMIKLTFKESSKNKKENKAYEE